MVASARQPHSKAATAVEAGVRGRARRQRRVAPLCRGAPGSDEWRNTAAEDPPEHPAPAMQAAPGAALPAPCARSARLRRRLEGETLARSYPRLPGDGSVLHIAYLRAPAEQGASDSNRVRATLGSGLVRAQGDGDLFDAKGATDAASVEADLQFFLRLAREQSCEIEFVEVVAQDGSESPSDSDCDEESSKVDSVVGVNGRSSPTTGLTTIEYRTDANGEAYSVQRDQLAYDMTCRDFVGVLSGVTCRFQQFGEYSSLTLSLPRAFSFCEDGARPASTERLLELLPDFYLRELPGDVILLANVAVRSVKEIRRAARRIREQEPRRWQELGGANATLGSVPTDDVVRVMRDWYGDEEELAGATSGRAGTSSYYTTFKLGARYCDLNAAFVYGDLDLEAVAPREVPEDNEINRNRRIYRGYKPATAETDDAFTMADSRALQRFLEMEQYRLLALIPLDDAKALSTRLRDIDRRVLETISRQAEARTFSGERRRKDEELLLELVALSGEVEAINAIARNRLAAAQAYGNVVYGRMERLDLKTPMTLEVRSIGGVISLRLNPALQTYKVVGEQLRATSEQIQRAVDLLRTSVTLEQTKQQERLATTGTLLTFFALIATVLSAIRD